METFSTLIQFVIPLSVLYIVYTKYKNRNKKEEKEEVKLPWLISYIKLIYVDRVRLRPNNISVIFYLPLFFSVALTIVMTISNLKEVAYPPLPLEKMQTKQGTIKSIGLNKKAADILILTTDDGKDISFTINTDKKEVSVLLNKKVTVWYLYKFVNYFFLGNYIKEITVDNKSIRIYSYSYEKSLKSNEEYWNFTKYCFYVALVSAFILWIPNRKEFSIHRLNRMKLYKKNKKVK